MESKKIGRFTVEAKEWGLAGGRIYFTLKEHKSGRGNAQACYDIKEEQFIKCRNRVDASWEHAIREAFELE